MQKRRNETISLLWNLCAIADRVSHSQARGETSHTRKSYACHGSYRSKLFQCNGSRAQSLTVRIARGVCRQVAGHHGCACKRSLTHLLEPTKNDRIQKRRYGSCAQSLIASLTRRCGERQVRRASVMAFHGSYRNKLYLYNGAAAQ